MDLLDALLGDDIIPKEDPASEAALQAEESSQSSGWLKTASSSTEKEKERNHIEFWDTKITNVHPSKLVWAKNNYYTSKQNRAVNWFPARICEEHEGQYLALDDWPIPEDMVLVEFLGIPKREPVTPQKYLVQKTYTVPFHADVRGGGGGGGGGSPGQKRKQQQSMLNFATATTINSAADRDSKRHWNSNSVENMINFLGFLKTQTQCKLIEANIMSKARQYLSACLAYADSMEAKALAEEAQELQKRQIAEENDEHAVGASSSDESIDFSKYARQGLKAEKHVKIVPDTWLSYTHKLFKMKKFTRVVEVKAKGADPRVIVENGDILDSMYQVRVMQTLPDGTCDKEAGYSYKALREYKFKVGRSKKLKDLHDRVDAYAANHKLDVGGGGARRGPHGPQDDEGDDDNEFEGVYAAAVPSSSSGSSSSRKRVHELKEEGGRSGDNGNGTSSSSSMLSDKRAKLAESSSRSRSKDLSDSSDSDDADADAVFS